MRLRTLLDVSAVWGLRVAAVVCAPLLVFTARTWHGRAVGVFTLAGWVGIFAYIGANVAAEFIPLGPPPPPPTPFGLSPRLFELILLVCILLGVAAFGWFVLSAAVLLLTQPNYRSDTLGLRSVFFGPHFLHRIQMMLMSETDWLWLGTLLVTRFDFRITGDERRLIRDTVRTQLDELKESGESRVIPPALPFEVWGRVLNPDPGHLFAYRPDAEPGERLGLLVFLHGHGGNCLLYPHLLRRLADDARCALVCPTFGYGNWEHPHSTGCVERAVRWAVEHFSEIDAGRTWLMGLSQGGAGVGRAAVAMPGVFAGLIFVSPTMEEDVLSNDELDGRRVLVLHGDADRHVKWESVERGIAAARSSGADVTVHRHPAGRHFLLFADTEGVFETVTQWVRG